MAVDRISSALERDPSVDGDSQEEESDDSDNGMSDGDGPDDSMTLVKFQEEVRRDSLIRKSSNEMAASLKKGRLEPGGASS